MAISMPTKLLVLIVIMLVLLIIGLSAIFSAGGLTIPIFSDIDKLLKDFVLPGAK